jgi:alanine racemase
MMPNKMPLLLLGASSRGSEDTILHHDITPTIVSPECLSRFATAAQRVQPSKPIDVHVKLDTGMGRVGLTAESIEQFMAMWNSNPSWHRLLHISGLYTHMAKADETDKQYTLEQLERFNKAAPLFAQQQPLLHVSNSATVNDKHRIAQKADDSSAELLSSRLAFARTGISLYGMYASHDVDKIALPLRPLLSWKSRIVQLKSLEPGHGISYGALYRTHRRPTTRIATIPVGYADGFRRILGATKPQPPSELCNAWSVLVHGRRCHIVGRVCMDMLMIDVTDVPAAALDDEVVLLGRQRNDEISADDWAERLDTINYEVTCAIGARVARVYLRHGKPVALTDLTGSMLEDQYAALLVNTRNQCNATAAAPPSPSPTTATTSSTTNPSA